MEDQSDSTHTEAHTDFSEDIGTWVIRLHTTQTDIRSCSIGSLITCPSGLGGSRELSKCSDQMEILMWRETDQEANKHGQLSG